MPLQDVGDSRKAYACVDLDVLLPTTLTPLNLPPTDSANIMLLLSGLENVFKALQKEACAVLYFSRDSVKTDLKLTLCVIAQRQCCGVLYANSVKLLLKLTLRVIAQKVSYAVWRIQSEKY